MKRKYHIGILVCLCFIFTLEAQVGNEEQNYRRSSLYTILIAPNDSAYASVIENTFKNYLVSEKYNDHISGPRIIPRQVNVSSSSPEIEELKQRALTRYLDSAGFAKKMVAKWFNRNEKGEFNTNLIKERGMYNATEMDVEIARNSERGLALLADAGEDLIQNTFLVVNDFQYIDKEETLEKSKGIMSQVSDVGKKLGLFKPKKSEGKAVVAAEVVAKGYVIKADAYLYRLRWDENTASQFYNQMWVTKKNHDKKKVAQFDNTDLFKLEFIGKETAVADLQSTKFTEKSPEELISIATIKAADAVLAKLQRDYEVFRVKTPLVSVDPLAAKIGLKEGLEGGDVFEVLEQVVNPDGSIEYNRVGKIKVDPEHIWDNTYMAGEQESYFEYTTFTDNQLLSKPKFYPGMLIRQIN